MKGRLAKVELAVTAAEFRAAWEARRNAEAAVLFFLAGAAKERAIYQGRTAEEAFEAACRLLMIDAEGRQKIEEALA